MQMASDIRQQRSGYFRGDFEGGQKFAKPLCRLWIFGGLSKSQEYSAKDFSCRFSSKRRRQNSFGTVALKQLSKKMA